MPFTTGICHPSETYRIKFMKDLTWQKLRDIFEKYHIGSIYTAFLVIFSFLLIRRYVSWPVSCGILLSGAGILLIGDFKKRIIYLILLALFSCFERHFILQYSASFREIGHQALITLHITDPDEIKAYLKIFKRAEYILPWFFIAGIFLEYFSRSRPLCTLWQKLSLRSCRYGAVAAIVLAAAAIVFQEFCLPVSEYWKNWSEQGELYRKREQFRFFAESVDKDPVFTLLIIGESHRKDEFDRFAFDPAFSTAPTLLNAYQRGKLWNFDDVITPYQQTWFSVFTLLCRRGEDGHNSLWPEKGLIGLFKEAGFKTHFLNYQDKKPSQLGYHYFINEADNYINHREFSGTKFDHGMLAPLGKLMKNGKQKQLAVLKMVGTHFHYTSRYPKEYQRFEPCYGKKIGKSEYRIEDKKLLVNTYRNAMAFSVTFLDEAAKLIDNCPVPAVMLFVSDHGIINYDDGKNVFFGAAKSNFNIPCFVYGNDAWLKKLPEAQKKAMAKNRKLPATNSFILETIASLSGIKYKCQRKEMDLSSDQARPAVNRQVWVVKKKVPYDTLI